MQAFFWGNTKWRFLAGTGGHSKQPVTCPHLGGSWIICSTRKRPSLAIHPAIHRTTWPSGGRTQDFAALQVNAHRCIAQEGNSSAVLVGALRQSGAKSVRVQEKEQVKRRLAYDTAIWASRLFFLVKLLGPTKYHATQSHREENRLFLFKQRKGCNNRCLPTMASKAMWEVDPETRSKVRPWF